MISTTFPIDLVFPPQGHFTQPYLALPCIQAWLKAHGHDDVRLTDASVLAYDRFLSADYLARAARRVDESLPLERFRGLDELPFAEMEAYRAAVESAVAKDALIGSIDAAKAVLRGEDCFDPDRYAPAVRTLYHGLRLVSAAHFPSVLTPHNFTMAYANDRSAEVLAATLDRAANPFVAFYEEELLPALVARRPRLLGLSVIYGSQLIPALTLGRLVKAALPHCHVTAGGGFLAYIGKKLMAAPGLDACLDSVVFWEGEGPLLALADALKTGRSLGEVGSLTWFDRGERATRGGVRTVENAPAHPVRLDDAPVPDFEGLPFELYFSPETVLPYDVNRGCYYGECTFCTLPTVIGPGYRTRQADTIARQVVELRDRHGARHFNFITDCMPPGMIRDLPDALLAHEADITWWSDARVEPRAYTADGARRLYEAGCRKLLFGFETATPRLLKLMKKGQSARATLEVARNCAAADISVTFYAMVGFPSETKEEAGATLAFLLENADVVREVSLQTFHIDEVSEIYRDPSPFGLTMLDDPEADLQLYHDYVAEEGMTQEEAAVAFEEMMAGFRAHFPIFAGDNIYYFMQKSHYFLHLARGVTPDEFAARCRERAEHLEAVGGDGPWRAADGLATLELPFSYTATLKTLAHPLARAIRPDFLTGRYSEEASARARAALASLPRNPRLLAYAAGAAGASEVVELSPQAEPALSALADPRCDAAWLARQEPADRASLAAFAQRLARAGLLRAGERAVLTPHGAPSTASASPVPHS